MHTKFLQTKSCNSWYLLFMIIQSGKEELQTRQSYPKWIRWPRGLHMRVHYKFYLLML